MFSIFFLSLFQRSTKVPACHFSSHCEILPTCNHSNVRSSTVKMAKQSTVTVILRTEQHLVVVMISTSITMSTLTKARIVFTALAAHTSHQLGISIALNKPSCCLLVAVTSHQQKLNYFTEYYDIIRDTRTLKLT